MRCKNCGKTQSIIPAFLIPYKVHITEYITNAIKYKIIHESNNDTCIKYQLSRQLLKYWMDCFEMHFTRISVTICETNKNRVIREISKTIYDFIYKYYCENRMIYMMYISNDLNKPILKWAPT